MKTFFLVIIAACCFALVPRLAASEGLDVQLSVPWTDMDGYTPFVVSLASHAGAGRVELEAENGNARARLTVDLPAETRVMRTVLLPGLSPGHGSLALHVRGTIGGKDVDQTVTATSVVHGFRELDLAVVDPHEDFPLSDARAAVKSRITGVTGSPKSGYSYRGTSAGYADSRLDRIAPEALPDRWQGYPTWLTVLITPGGEAELDAEQRAALATWSTAGGMIFVTEERQLPAWRAAGAHAMVIGATSPALIDRIEAVGRVSSFTPSRTPVPGTDRVHVLGFVVLAVLFSIVVGPLNLWWVRRQNALHLFLITTPVISLATCVCLVVVGFLAEGLGTKRSATQFAILDQARARVVAWTGVSYFSGMSISRIALDGEDEVLTMDQADFAGHAYYRPGSPFSIDWGDGQRLSGAVVPARVNRQLAYVSARPEKRRLILERDGGGWRVINGLGCAIRELVWLDARSAGWRCGTLAPGAAARMDSLLWTPPATPQDSERIGLDTTLAWEAVLPTSGARNAFRAVLDDAFVPVPGPGGSDQSPITTELIGFLEAPTSGVNGGDTPVEGAP
ncbi:MAG: hypothetical protein H0V44_10335 [Planctomycetes bacterium]|nr:hypothetical protein [Planctomycetota bacterium]